MSFIRKECKKAFYVVILFLFLIKPAADQAPLIMSASEWIFIQCRKAGKITGAENFTGFLKTVVSKLLPPAFSPACKQPSSRGLFLRLNGPQRCQAPRVPWLLYSRGALAPQELAWCTLAEELACSFDVTGDDFTTYSNAQRNRRPSLFLEGAGKMAPRHHVQPVANVESQHSLNASSYSVGIPGVPGHCSGLLLRTNLI